MNVYSARVNIVLNNLIFDDTTTTVTVNVGGESENAPTITALKHSNSGKSNAKAKANQTKTSAIHENLLWMREHIIDEHLEAMMSAFCPFCM